MADSPGAGKTHLAVALGLEAISQGMGVYFIIAHDMIADLKKADRENRLERRMKVHLAPGLLIVNEIGYLPLDQQGAAILFQLVTPRYEKGSMILTSKRKSPGCWSGALPGRHSTTSPAPSRSLRGYSKRNSTSCSKRRTPTIYVTTSTSNPG